MCKIFYYHFSNIALHFLPAPTQFENISFSKFQAVEAFMNDWTMEELMGFLFGAGMDWSDVDATTVSPAPVSASP